MRVNAHAEPICNDTGYTNEFCSKPAPTPDGQLSQNDIFIFAGIFLASSLLVFSARRLSKNRTRELSIHKNAKKFKRTQKK